MSLFFALWAVAMKDIVVLAVIESLPGFPASMVDLPAAALPIGLFVALLVLFRIT